MSVSVMCVSLSHLCILGSRMTANLAILAGFPEQSLWIEVGDTTGRDMVLAATSSKGNADRIPGYADRCPPSMRENGP